MKKQKDFSYIGIRIDKALSISRSGWYSKTLKSAFRQILTSFLCIPVVKPQQFKFARASRWFKIPWGLALRFSLDMSFVVYLVLQN